MMWRTVIVLGCFAGAVFTSPVGLKDIPMTDDALLHQKTEMAMSTLNLPSNATSIRADITDGFNCDGRLYGYYADIDNDCQIFHVCLPVTYPDGKENTFRWSFICPEDTIFSQESFTCVRGLDLGFDCAESVRFYDLNRNFGIASDMDSDMNDFLRKTPTETINVVPVESKPAIQATTAKPVYTRRRPGESNVRRQPTKTAATTAAPVLRAQPTRITPAAVSTPAEIKPMFNRNEFMKNNLANGLRKTPIRPAVKVEESKPVEIVPKFEGPVRKEPVVEDAVKKTSAVPIQSGQVRIGEAPGAKINLRQPVQSEQVKTQDSSIVVNDLDKLPAKESAPITPSAEIPQLSVEPIKSLPVEVSKPSEDSLPQITLSTLTNENENKPAETPLKTIEASIGAAPEIPMIQITQASIEATPEVPMTQMNEETPLHAGEQNEQNPMKGTLTASGNDMLKMSDSSSSASTESKLTEEMVALPETMEPVKQVEAPEMQTESKPAEEMSMENLSSTKTENMNSDQDLLPLTVQEVKPEAMQPETMQLNPGMEAVSETENLKSFEEQINTRLAPVEDQEKPQRLSEQENFQMIADQENAGKADLPLPTPESLPEQPSVALDPIVKHVLEAAADNVITNDDVSLEQTPAKPVEAQQLKTETLSQEQLKVEPEMPVKAETSPLEMLNNEPLKESIPMMEMQADNPDPEKLATEKLSEISNTKTEQSSESLPEKPEMVKNEQQLKLETPTQIQDIVLEDLKSPDQSQDETEQQTSLTPVKSEQLKTEPSANSQPQMENNQPEVLGAQAELPSVQPEMSVADPEPSSAQLEMLKLDSEVPKQVSEVLHIESEPAKVAVQDISSDAQTAKLDSEISSEQADQKPMMQQNQPAMLNENSEPEMTMPMQQTEPEMLKTEQKPEMPAEEPEPVMMMQQQSEPLKEEPEMMKTKTENEDPQIAAGKIESVESNQILKTDSEKLEDLSPAPEVTSTAEEMPGMNSEEQKSEIVKAISSLVNEATQEVGSPLSPQITPSESAFKSDINSIPPAPEMMIQNPEPQPFLDMDTLMASPDLLDNQPKIDIPSFIPVKVIMDDAPAPELPAVPLVENSLKNHFEGHLDNMVPVETIDEAEKQITKTAQSEPITVENQLPAEMVVKNAETPAPEKEVTQVMLESDPVEMKDNQNDGNQVALKAEILPMPEEKVKIVEDQPNIEMVTPDKPANLGALRFNIPLPKLENTDPMPVPELIQDTIEMTRLADSQPIFQGILDFASNLVKAETMSASADDFPIVVNDTADETKETEETKDSTIFSKSAPTADGLSGAQMVDGHHSEELALAKFSEPIEETGRQNEVSGLMRFVSPEKIGELVERTELPEATATRLDLGRSLQKKLDPRKRRFLFKSSSKNYR